MDNINKELDKSIRSVLNRYGSQVVEKMREELIQNGSIASSKLYNSLTFSVRKKVDEWILSFSSEDYAKYVESGRKPGKFPPISKIKEWTKQKGIPEKAAYPIAMKIYKFGIPPKPFIKPAFNMYKDEILKTLVYVIKTETVNTFTKELRYIMKK